MPTLESLLLSLSQGSGACFMAVEQCAQKINRVEVRKEKKGFQPESKPWAFHVHLVSEQLSSKQEGIQSKS